jgi:hypothetical protein
MINKFNVKCALLKKKKFFTDCNKNNFNNTNDLMKITNI